MYKNRKYKIIKNDNDQYEQNDNNNQPSSCIVLILRCKKMLILELPELHLGQKKEKLHWMTLD